MSVFPAHRSSKIQPSMLRLQIHALRILAFTLTALFVSTFAVTIVSAARLYAPSITATKTDVLIGDDGDGRADPGETIQYTTVIGNTGTDATGVVYDDTIDSKTSLIPTSINVSPLAGDDVYDTIGNTLLDVGVSAADPAVHVAGESLFDNDTEYLADTFTLKSVEADTSAPFTNVATEQAGGSVTVNLNGTFTYLPPVGFTGVDHFDYIITDDGPDNILGNGDDLTGAGRVTINVTQRVWYVKNNAAVGGLGRSTDPFDTLAEAQTASANNDTIYVFFGTGTTTGQNAGITLKSGQRLIGEGVALTVPVSVNGGPNPTTLRAAGSQPRVDNSGAGNNAVAATDLVPAEIRGLSLSSAAANAIDITIGNGATGTLQISNNTIFGAGTEGIDINHNGSAALTLSVQNNTWNTGGTHTGDAVSVAKSSTGALNLNFSTNTNILSTAGSGVVLNGATGTGDLTVTGFANNTVNANTASIGITANTVTFDATPGGTFQTVSGGTTTISSGGGLTDSGMILVSVEGDLSFTDLDIVATNGTGLSATSGAVYNNSGPTGVGFQLAVGSGATISATNGPAVGLSTVTASLPFSDIDSSASTTTGVSLAAVLGSFSAGSGSTITNATNADFLVSNSNATITYNGSISDSTTTGPGVTLGANTGSTISFTGPITISSGSNAAFSATGGGTVTATDTTSTLTSTTGTALTVTSTTIGASGLKFRSISSNGAVNGILLNATGSSGGLSVLGNGGSCSSAATCTGGAIQNSSADAVKLTSTNSVILTNMYLFTSAGSNVDASSVTGLTLTGIYSDLSTGAGILGSTVTNLTITNGTYDRGGAGSVPCNVNGLDFTNLLGTSTVTGATFKRSNTIQFRVNNNTATSFAGTPDQLTVSNTTWNTHTNTCAGDHLSVNSDTGANFKLIVNSSIGVNTFTTSGTGVQATAGGTNGKMMALVSGINDSNNTAAVVIGNTGTASTNIFNISNNTISGTGSLAIAVTHVSGGATTSGTIDGNNITHTAGPGTNALQVVLEGGGTLTTTISNNIISGNYQRGIQAQSRLGTGTLCATINNNTLTGTDTTGVALQQINIETGGSGTGHGNSICLNMHNNSVNLGPGATYTAAYRLTNRAVASCTIQPCSFQLQNFTGNGALTADVQNWVTTTKSNSGLPVSVTASQAFVASSGNCPLPLAVAPNSIIVAQAQPGTAAVALSNTSSKSVRLSAPKTFIRATVSNNLSKRTVWSKAPATQVKAGGNSPRLYRVSPALSLSGENVNILIGNLPANKSITVVFRVTVDSPLPQNATKITNQGTVNFDTAQSIQTTNGGTVNCEVGSETCTPIDLVDLSVSKSNDTSNTVVLGTDFSWQIQVSNVATSRDAIFTNGQVVLEDHLPSTVTYDAPNVAATGGVIGLPSCSITTNVLTCTAGAGGLTIPSGEGVAVAVIVHTATAAPGPLVNPTGGVCKVDPNTVFAEVSTANNSCSNTVTVTRPNTTVVSLTRTDSNPNNTSSVGWQIVFANPVSGVTASNFSVIQGGSVTGASIDSVGTAIQASEPDTTWNITVDTGTGDGTLGLNFVNDTGMNYAVTNTTYTGEVYTIDKTAPTVTNVSSDSNTGCLGSGPVYCNAGDVVTIKVTFNEIVNVTGTPQLTLETGSTDAVVDYTGGSGTNTLTFDYTVASGHNSLDLDYINSTALSLNGGDIEDLATNNATLTLPNPGASGSLGFNESIVIDTIPPIMINSVTSSVANGTYGVAALIPISISYSEIVNVTGTPQLTLETGTTDEVVDYSSGSSTITLTYNYTVQAGDMSADLDYISANALSLNGGSIRDNAGNNAILTLPTPGAPFSLGATKDIVIDSRPPADVSITKTDGVTTATAGGTVTYTIVASNSGPSPVTGGTVVDTFPASLTVNWTCVGAGGGTCTAGPVAGNINDTVNLPVGASVTYTASANINPSASGNLVNTATVSVPVTMLDPTPLNNSATDTDTLAASADLSITKTDGVTTAIPGGSVTYTITASNAGPSDVTGATVADTFPASLTVSWTCVGAGGGTCTAGPTSGNINDTVNLPAGGSVTYTATANISPAATGTLNNTATVAAPGGVTDPNPANNSALDMDTLTPQADLSITKTDGVTVVIPGGTTTYTIVASNAGPSNTSATVSDTFPASLTASWTCVGAGGGTCTAGPVSGNINDSVSLPAGGSVTYTVSANISGAASGTISNTATVSGVATDPVPGNNSATDNDNVVPPVNVTINQKTSAPAQADPSNGPTINFTVVFASTVTGFNSASDVTLSGTAGATTAVITGSGTTYNVAVSGMTTDGTVIVDVPAGVATGTLGQPNAASTSTDNTVDYDGTEPDTIIDAPMPNNPTNLTTANFAFHGTDSGSGIDGAGYECQLDGGGFSGCSSVRSYSGLTDGSHTFQVRSTDVAGNVDSTPASFTWVVDTVAPDTIIDTNPTNPSNSATGAFTFHGVPGTGSAIGSVECKLDSGSFAACDTITSHTLTGLSEGSHTFSVRAIDAAGNTDASPATYTWTVDTVAPTTTLLTNPSNPTTSTSAAFTFSGADTGGTGVASFQCQLDGGGYSTCTSPKNYASLGDGSHTFDVRAVDAAGNMDASPASFTWVVDATAPNTTIDPTPPSNPTNSTSATFNFSGNDGTGVGGLTFECKLDSGSFALCTSPKNYPGLSAGSHTFLVRAKDSLGNTDPTPASHTWIIDTTVPTVVVSSTTTSPTNTSPITVTIMFSEVVTGFTASTASGDIVIGGVGGGDSLPTGGGTTYSFQLAPSGQGAVTVTVPANSAQDLAGNFNTVSNTFSITYDSVAPTVTINQAGTQSDPTSLSPINYTVVFNEAINVASFTGADVTLGGTAGATTAVVTQIAPMNGTTFNVAVSGMTVSGTVIASITANKVTDAAGNNNTASSSTDNSVTFDATPLTVTINQAATQTDPDFADSATKKIHFTAVFSEPVTGFTGTDVSFAGTTLMGTLSATVTQIAPMDGTTYDVAVKGMLPKGTVFVSIPANSATSIARLVGNQASTSTDNNIIVDYVLVEYTSTGSKDGWVLESTETSGVGGSLDSTATTSRVGDDASDRQYRSILDFATGSLPDSAVFFSVNLRIIEHSITGTNPFTTHGFLKLEIKDGFFGTASALQNPDFESAPDKSACNFETVPEILESIGTAYRCIFFESSYPYINVTGSTQFKLRFTNDDNDDLSADIFNFYSGDYGGLTQRPRLFIKYYIPPAP